VKASRNWGKIEAPKLANTGCLPPRRTTPSACGQAGSWTTINEFIHTRCMELKEEWQAK